MSTVHKVRMYNNATIEKAHDVRTLRACKNCSGLGNTHSMLHVEIANEMMWLHGRCFIKALGLANFLRLPKRETHKMRIDDIGIRAMKALLNMGAGA